MKHKFFTLKTSFGSVYNQCYLSVAKYYNGHTAVEIMCEEGPYARLTVNIEGIELYPENYSCVDTNNFAEAEDVIAMLGIGKPTGEYLLSGWCSYPVYEFKKEIESNG